MIATSEYHELTDIDEFINNVPSDMIATWDFISEKTKKYKLFRITFSNPETNNLFNY